MLFRSLVAVAAPVFNHEGKVVAAISISGPDARINRDQLNKFGELIIKELKNNSTPNGKAGAA